MVPAIIRRLDDGARLFPNRKNCPDIAMISTTAIVATGNDPRVAKHAQIQKQLQLTAINNAAIGTSQSDSDGGLVAPAL
jgi:hypothetical protein